MLLPIWHRVTALTPTLRLRDGEEAWELYAAPQQVTRATGHVQKIRAAFKPSLALKRRPAQVISKEGSPVEAQYYSTCCGNGRRWVF